MSIGNTYINPGVKKLFEGWPQTHRSKCRTRDRGMIKCVKLLSCKPEFKSQNPHNPRYGSIICNPIAPVARWAEEKRACGPDGLKCRAADSTSDPVSSRIVLWPPHANCFSWATKLNDKTTKLNDRQRNKQFTKQKIRIFEISFIIFKNASRPCCRKCRYEF